ncbi:LOW QUALITY PROTEIN: hypothetical protein HID58_034134 [Brassica napus]|uniref:Uncharacterized protein n=1 Tax=Brassica napus TaxID=3708 RepID=A0ABQ8C198_BRANA|nr:LOW QUALITY PROTEIN: hypothetical protein HID58_034134 [Brassica napus]
MKDIICILAAGCSQFRSYRGRRKSIIRFLKGTRHRSLLLCPSRIFFNLAHIFRADFSLGRHVIEQLLGLPVGRREISFLVSEEALDRSAEALEEYKRALEVTAASKAAIHQVVPAGFNRSGTRQEVPIVAPSSSKKRSRASVFKPSLSASRSCSKALASLNLEVFPMTPIRPSIDEDTSKVVRSLQGDVLQGRMKDRSATKAKGMSWLSGFEEEICELWYAAEVFDAEKIKVVNDAKVVVHAGVWLDDQTNRWDPITSFEQYKVVKISEAEFLGLPPPSIEYKP